MILAMVFMIVLALIVLGLANQAANDLSNVKNFTSAQATEQATSGALTTAIATERYFFNAATLNAIPAAPCFSSGNYQIPIETGMTNGPNVTMDAWCTTQWTPFNGASQTDGSAMRVVTVYVCEDPGTGDPVSTLMTNCIANPLGEAVVRFNDQPDYNTQLPVSRPVGQNCLPLTTPTSLNTTCGGISTVTQWLYAPTAPTITQVTGSLVDSRCPSGLSVTIAGTNLLVPEGLTVVANPDAAASGVANTQTNAAANVVVVGTPVPVSSTNVTACIAGTSSAFATGAVILRTYHGTVSARY